MPIYMRLGKQRGPTRRTRCRSDRTARRPRASTSATRAFDAGAEVTPEVLKEAGLIRKHRVDVKILGQGELTKKLAVTAHRFSSRAREKIEGAGGTVKRSREPVDARRSAHEGPRRSASEPRDASRSKEDEPSPRAEPPSPSRRGRRVADVLLARQRLARPGAPAPRALHGADPRDLPPRLVDPGARRRLRGDRELLREQGGTVLGLLNLFSGGALSQFAIFALGIMPYVTASIILQLMTVVIPRLEQLQKEGEAGLRQDQPVHALPDGRARGAQSPATRTCSSARARSTRTPAGSC